MQQFSVIAVAIRTWNPLFQRAYAVLLLITFEGIYHTSILLASEFKINPSKGLSECLKTTG